MQKQKLAEIAVLRYIPDAIYQACKKGRLKSKLEQLLREVDKELKVGPNIKNLPMKEITNKIREWSTATGWEEKPKHIISAISFLSIMIENSQYQYRNEIYRIMNEIVDYYERVGNAKLICMVSGQIAYEKWERIVGGIC